MTDESAIPEEPEQEPKPGSEPEPEPASEQKPEPESDSAPGRDPDQESDPAPQPHRQPRPRPRRRRGLVSLACLVVLALLGSLFVPEVRTLLRQSFTRLPQASTALYFTEDPSIRGAVLNVPITVDGTDTGISTYQVKVWTETATGKVDASTDAQVPTVKGVTAAVVTLPIAPDAAVVWASLNGTNQAIHFKFS